MHSYPMLPLKQAPLKAEMQVIWAYNLEQFLELVTVQVSRTQTPVLVGGDVAIMVDERGEGSISFSAL